MISRNWLASTERLQMLAKAQVLTIAVVVAVGALLGFRAFAFNSRAGHAKATAQANAAHVMELRTQLSATGGMEPPRVPTGLQAVSAFQAAIDSAASERGCEITEFQAEADMLPYLSRFRKLSDESDWLQLEIRMSLRGTLSSLLDTLSSMEEFDMPTEINSVELARAVAAPDHAVIDARVQLRVLTR